MRGSMFFSLSLLSSSGGSTPVLSSLRTGGTNLLPGARLTGQIEMQDTFSGDAFVHTFQFSGAL